MSKNTHFQRFLTSQLAQDGTGLPEGSEYDWWLAPKKKLTDDERLGKANNLVRYAQDLEESQRDVHEMMLQSGQQYSNRQVALFEWGTGDFIRASLKPLSRVYENLTAVVIDTLVAQIGKNRPKATPIARGASWRVRTNAKKLDKFLWGETCRQSLYSLFKSAFRTGCIYPFGVIRHDWDGQRVKLSECFPDDIIVDEREVASSGDYSHIIHRRVLPIAKIAEMYGVSEETIAEQEDERYDDGFYRRIGKGYALLVEVWLKAQGGRPGRYVAATKKLLLEDKAWEHEWVPFVFFRYNEPVAGRGFYTPSVVEVCLPFQVRLNEMDDAIRADLRQAGYWWAVEENSKVNPNDLLSRSHRVVRYRTTRPELQRIEGPIEALYNERARIGPALFSRIGLNQMSNATLPAGVRYDSSPALQEANAIQDDRLADPAQRYEEFILNNFKLLTKMSALYATDDTTTVYEVGGRAAYTEEIRWSAIDLDDNSYVLQLEVSSAHSMTPAAARQRLEELLGQGIISPEAYAQAVAHPDSEAAQSLLTAAADRAKWVVSQLEEGVYVMPIPEEDLVKTKTLVMLSLLSLDKYTDVPDEVYQAHRDWLEAATELLTRATEADAQGAPPIGDMGPGMPQIPGVQPPGQGAMTPLPSPAMGQPMTPVLG